MMPDETSRPESRARRTPAWCIEMFESPLLDRGITYESSEHPTGIDADAPSWIQFQIPTRGYANPHGAHTVTVRLTVAGGCLAITAPGLYPRNSLIRTTEPPPDREGNLRVVRLGDHDTSQIDLIMAADGEVKAVLRMETILQPFNRQDIVVIAEQFAGGIDLLDFAVRKSRLLKAD